MRGAYVALLLLSACKPESTARISIDALRRESGRLCTLDGGLCAPPLECIGETDRRTNVTEYRCLLACKDQPDCPRGSWCINVATTSAGWRRTCELAKP